MFKKISLISFVFVFIIVCSSNLWVYLSTKDQFNKELQEADCILVLGAGVKDNQPTPMLKDRLEKAVELYKNHKAFKIIMSGDHSRKDYDEVNVMKRFAIDNGVPSADIFMDHAGFSTYESLYRAKAVFNAKKVIIVTQDYHLYRALYIANQLDIDAVGANVSRQYSGQFQRNIREVIARVKDVFTCIIQPQPTYLGESIPVHGNGDITNDKAI